MKYLMLLLLSGCAGLPHEGVRAIALLPSCFMFCSVRVQATDSAQHPQTDEHQRGSNKDTE